LSHYNKVTNANRRPPTQPNPGRTTGATPPEEIADVDEEVSERVAVEAPVEDAGFLSSDELEDPL